MIQYADLCSEDMNSWNYPMPCVSSMLLKNGRDMQCCFEAIQWKIAWSFHIQYSTSGKQLARSLVANYVHPWTP